IKGKKFKVGKTTIEVDHFKENAGGRYALYLTMTTEKGKDDKDENMTEMDGGIELQDAKGNSYQQYGSGLSGHDNILEAHYSYGPPFNGGAIGPPAKLVYITSTTVEYHVPFEFKNVPLP